jgi:hypothetical protein
LIFGAVGKSETHEKDQKKKIGPQESLPEKEP